MPQLPSPVRTIRLNFAGHDGAQLAARLDRPAGPIRAYALFAHCFTCSKDILAARRIASELARMGYAVLRFDFTGLGASKGEFASTNFSSNVADLLRAADHLRQHYQAPSLLIGHSLGGAAVLAAAGDVPEVKAVATIGAPADVAHVLHNFGAHLDEIETAGEAELKLGGRPFRIKRQFIEDARAAALAGRIATMRKALLVLHSPIDATVGIENAGQIFTAAKHPKSFVTLDGADHLLTDDGDARFAATMIANFAERYLPPVAPTANDAPETVRVAETGEGKFQCHVVAGAHQLYGDEPKSVGGDDLGPSPYDFLAMSLGTCTAMTLRMYADFKKLELGRITVDVAHEKIHVRDCTDCVVDDKATGKIDRFERRISIDGDVPAELASKLLEIADKCPVHKTLHQGAAVVTKIVEPDA